MLGRGLAGVGIILGTVDELVSDLAPATSTPADVVSETVTQSRAAAAPTTPTAVAESESTSAPSGTNSGLLVAIAVAAALGAAVLGWLGWRSR